jgi:hypothetical protein
MISINRRTSLEASIADPIRHHVIERHRISRTGSPGNGLVSVSHAVFDEIVATSRFERGPAIERASVSSAGFHLGSRPVRTTPTAFVRNAVASSAKSSIRSPRSVSAMSFATSVIRRPRRSSQPTEEGRRFGL